MPDNADLIEKYEDELRQLISRMHKDGIPYEGIYHLVKSLCQLIKRMHQDGISSEIIDFVMEDIVKSLDLKVYCEKWLKEYATDKGLVAETI